MVRMSNLFGILLFFVCFASFISPANAGKPLRGKGGDYVPGELLVKFKTMSKKKIGRAIKKLGAKKLRRVPRIKVMRLKLKKGMKVEKALQEIKSSGLVKYAEPNYIYRHCWEPSDSFYNEQWGLKKIEVTRGWGMETGTNKTIIAIVDTGVDLDHPDLKNKIVDGYDFVNHDDDPDDTQGHGTHCAGIAAASTNNGIGVSGVCANCSIMPIRVLGNSGGSSSDVADGIIWAADNGAHVISMSLGSAFPSSAISDAINYAANKGSFLIAAAGNSNTTDYHYPAAFQGCLAVGSTDDDDSRSYFSNYGNWVDVAAPGNKIMSSIPNNMYEKMSGTSMATPYVSGLAGLLFSCPGANADSVKKAIKDSSEPVGNWVARGRINVPKALERLGCGDGSSGGGGGDDSADDEGKTTGPSGYNVTWGRTVDAPSNSLVASDDKKLVLKCKGKGYDNVLDFYIDTKGQSRVGAKKLIVKFEASFTKAGEVTAYFYNWNGNKWDWIGKHYLDTNDKTVRFSRDNPGAYISEQGEVRVKFYRKEKRWIWFDIKGDSIRFTVVSK